MLLASGISKACPCLHFNDLSEPIEAAMVRRLSILVEASIGSIEEVANYHTEDGSQRSSIRALLRQ
ncbi:MAG: hypothetical protein OR995_07660 [Candidatus Nanopelagicales bacterium]|nr:hypothetical protein [Candidatus Nanopelagicales bacterium]